MIETYLTSIVLKLTTTNQVDTNVSNDDYSQYFKIPRKHNHSATEICDTKNKTTQGPLKVHLRLCQHISSMSTSSLKIPPFGEEYLCFQTEGETSQAEHCSK